MAESSEIPTTAHEMPNDEFKALFDKCYQEYVNDLQQNKVLILKKEIADLHKKIALQVADAAYCENLCATIVQQQEKFLKRMVAKTSTRTVGVYVNITSPKDKNNTSRNIINQPTTQLQTTLNQLKTEIGCISSNSTQEHISKPNVDVVDLTMEEDKNRIKCTKSSETVAINQPKQIFVTAAPQNFAAVARPIYQMSTQIGAPQVRFPSSNVYSSPVIGSSSIQAQRPILVLPTGASLNMRPSMTSKPEVSGQYIIGGGASSVLLSRPPIRPILDTNKPIATYSNASLLQLRHPAPLPEQPYYALTPGEMDLPPKPNLKISRPATGIVLSWNMNLTCTHAAIKTYQLYGYDESSGASDTSAWKKVGEVNALPLPMACTLTQFLPGRRYHFAIRALDVQSRLGPFSDVASISLVANST